MTYTDPSRSVLQTRNTRTLPVPNTTPTVHSLAVYIYTQSCRYIAIVTVFSFFKEPIAANQVYSKATLSEISYNDHTIVTFIIFEYKYSLRQTFVS